MASLAELRTYVRHMTLVELDDITDAELTAFLNEGYRRLANRFPWPWLQETATITTVAAQADYARPTDLRRVVAIVEDAEDRRLARLSFEQAISKWGGDFPDGEKASWYYLYHNKINLVPTPDAAAKTYTVYYQKAITPLANDVDVPEFDIEYHYSLATYAVARVWEHEEDIDKSTYFDARFAMEVDEMASMYIKEAEDYPRVYGEGLRPAPYTTNMPWLDGV